ncbi:MAG: PDZ domain-containing protein, partial [Rubrivivax sp.]|nr:PDZ domain-containing protein [Rubrivivax sp.]
GLRGLRRGADGRFQPGDVIVGVEGRKVASVGQLFGRLDDFRPGERVRLQVQRDGRSVDVDVALDAGS